jgi:hypothetical protein
LKTIKLSLILLAVSTALSGCALFYPNSDRDEPLIDSSATQEPTATATSDPEPTASPSASESAAKAKAEGNLVYWEISQGSLMVIGEITNVFETSGTCVISFYSGESLVVEERVKAEANISSMQCFPVNIALSKLPKGSGFVTVGYESDSFEGSSEKFEVTIP